MSLASELRALAKRVEILEKGGLDIPESTTDDPVLHFGRFRGRPVSRIPRYALQWYQRVLEENIADRTKALYAQENRETLEAITVRLKASADTESSTEEESCTKE